MAKFNDNKELFESLSQPNAIELVNNDFLKENWSEASVILANSTCFSQELMAEIGKKFFENSWIDVPPAEGKEGGAYAHPVVPSVHPYIMLNYMGKTDDIMTLAHELGHGIHQYLARKQGYLLSDTPLTLAETASVFGEMLTFKYMLKIEQNPHIKFKIRFNIFWTNNPANPPHTP